VSAERKSENKCVLHLNDDDDGSLRKRCMPALEVWCCVSATKKKEKVFMLFSNHNVSLLRLPWAKGNRNAYGVPTIWCHLVFDFWSTSTSSNKGTTVADGPPGTMQPEQQTM